VTTEPGLEQIRAALGEATADGRLEPERLADAAARVALLGDTLRRSRERLSIPAEMRAGVVPGVDAALVAETFRVSDRARNLLSLRASRGAPLTWVKLDPEANIAVGATPWGPFAAGIEPVAVIGPDREALAGRSDGALVIVVGKDNHRFEWACSAIDALRSRGDVIAVDMGWPDPDYAYADVATLGASRLVGNALLRLIG
jgi:beta-N-acetylhexosaminidase